MDKTIRDIELAFRMENLRGVQAFDSRNTVGDPMCTIYNDGNVQIDYCYYYDYVEIFGLSDEGWEQLKADNYIRDWR